MISRTASTTICICSTRIRANPTVSKGFFSETIKKVKKLAACHEFAEQIRELKSRIVEASQRRDRYKLDAVLDSGSSDVVLIGIDAPRDELIKLVDDGEKSLKVVSIVGSGGLGKTTVANQVYQKVREQFECRAFVSVSQKPDTRKILQSILSQIRKQEYEGTESGDEECLINALRDFLEDKRYFIVIDDIWSAEAWEIIKCALLENTCGSRILVTTRIATVAKSCCSPRHDLVYELRPLSKGDSKSLFLLGCGAQIGLWGANTGTIRSGEVINSLALELLEKVTGGFSEENNIGSGGYGKVYKGILNGKEIAVKRLHDHLALDDVIFKNEFENLKRVQHQNIVELVGYCNETRHINVEHNGRIVRAEMVDRVLCFEYLQNGSLDKHLYEEHRGLDWCTRYKIIKGICEGLNYLHGLEESILHLDLKPANILLDENMVPKIADFGLSRLFGETHTHITKNLAGTGMYMPPEYIRECKITKKYDVFSLGVIIIQIMTGPKGYSEYGEMSPQQFIELVHQNWKVRVEAEATSMHTSAGEDCKQVKRCIEIALNCVVTEREKRPTIGDIIHKLIETETMKQKDSSNEQPGSLEKEYQEDTKKRAASGIYEVSTPFSQELESVSRQFGRAVAHDEKEVRSELEAMKEERGGGGGMQESRSVGGRIEMEVVHGEKELWSNKLETIKQERGGKQEAAFSKIGPWGGSAGRAHSIKVAPHRLESVTIWSADIVDAFAFSYSDHNGNKHTIGPFGGPGGRVYRIEFAPSEFLLEVSGTIGSYAWAVADVVQTITLVTNASSYGPFGQVGGGTPFHTSIQSNDRIVGFFGRGGMFVHAIGVYVRHFERKMVQGGKEVIFGLDEEALAKIGPWGGNGGMAYDMKVAPHRLESLTICCGVVIDSLAFSYDDLNGKQHTMGPWGGPGGNTYTIRLGPFEFLSGVSGTVGSFGTIPNVITSLMFTTNHGRSYGPLGQGGGTSFRIPVENNGCIVGFFGRAGSCVEALGVYIRTH